MSERELKAERETDVKIQYKYADVTYSDRREKASDEKGDAFLNEMKSLANTRHAFVQIHRRVRIR